MSAIKQLFRSSEDLAEKKKIARAVVLKRAEVEKLRANSPNSGRSSPVASKPGSAVSSPAITRVAEKVIDLPPIKPHEELVQEVLKDVIEAALKQEQQELENIESEREKAKINRELKFNEQKELRENEYITKLQKINEKKKREKQYSLCTFRRTKNCRRRR